MKREQEFQVKLYSMFMEYLDRAKDIDGFVDLVEKPFVEAVMNHCDGDVLRASELIGCSKTGLANRLRREFGTAKIGGNQVLLRPMRIRGYQKVKKRVGE
ncbi:MAG TPA: helix-turn-helix domain-containing protein, partial [Myxococcota bacterium]|nr:helix-turn-helix domain-containing protein [Myxococcota bacterium]